MGTQNEEFEIETTLDLDNLDIEAGKRLEKAAERPEIEVEEEVSLPPARREKAPAVAESDEPTEEELAQYSESVKKRIDKLVKAREEAKREALRLQQERDEAMLYAQNALAQRKALEEQSRKLGEESVSALEQKLDADIKAARAELVEALNTYDTEAAADAQMKIADLTAQKREVAAKKVSRPVAQPAQSVLQPQSSTRPAPDNRAQEWVARNSAWFQKDKAMTAFVFGVHEDLVEKGVDPRIEADKYYRALDEAVRKRFPEQFGEEAPSTSAPRSVVAPATRSTTGRKKVTLTANELSIARRLGVTPEQFAREKMLLENRNV
jgi:hypothetical protein